MIKIFVFLSLVALVFAKPGYIHSAPVLTSYHQTASVPIAHVVRPIAAVHGVAAAPAVIHGSSYHGSYHHGLY